MATLESTGPFCPRVGPGRDTHSQSTQARRREIARARRPLVGMMFGAVLAVPLWALILKLIGLY